MNQEKIGKFIAECRKNQNLTQENLAEFLNVSNRTISKWENGKCMPDYSILPSLCDKLNISITELLSGEKLEANEYQQKLEKSMILNMDLLKKKMLKYIKRLAFIIIFLIGISVLPFALFFIYLEISQFKIYLPKEKINTTICKQENGIHVIITSNSGEPILSDDKFIGHTYSYKAYRTLSKKYMQDVSSAHHTFLPEDTILDSITIYDEVIYEKGMELEECNFDD